MKKYYLFDFDGTLVDSMSTYISSMLQILNDSNVSYSNDIVKSITPLGLNGTAEYYINELGIDIPKDQLISMMRGYMLDAYLYTIQTKSNVQSVLEILKRQGASLNVLTASPHVTLDTCLKRLGLWDLFDNVWSCDDFHTTKANPNIYLRVAQKLNTSIENILFLDDNLEADKAAKSAGMMVCGVYDASSEDYVEQIKSISDFYIFDFKELLNLKIDTPR